VIELILSNSSQDHADRKWDSGNRLMRELLDEVLGSSKMDRMFNNGHIGHNKFVVFEDGAGTPKAVMTTTESNRMQETGRRG